MKQIPLTRGLFATVDDADFDLLNGKRWHAKSCGGIMYAARCTGDREYGNRLDHFMHRVIMVPDSGFVVDHIDGDGLNNQRANLRVCSRSQNQTNLHRKATNKYWGVYFHKRAGKWAAQLMADGKHHYLGLYQTDIEAARARDAAAVRLQGDFARLNFPGGQLEGDPALVANLSRAINAVMQQQAKGAIGEI